MEYIEVMLTSRFQLCGLQATRIEEQIKEGGRSSEMGGWNTWLSDKYGLIDYNKTGYILNIDGYASSQVHQIDRFGNLLGRWRQKMIHEVQWKYSKQELFCTREGSQKLPFLSHDIPMKEDFTIDFDEVRRFANANDPLGKVKGFTIQQYEGYMMAPAGKEHYALLNYLSHKSGDCRINLEIVDMLLT